MPGTLLYTQCRKLSRAVLTAAVEAAPLCSASFAKCEKCVAITTAISDECSVASLP